MSAAALRPRSMPCGKPPEMNHNPSQVAREALKQLVVDRLPPTPENYRHAYLAIISPGASPAAESTAAAMLSELVDELRAAGSNGGGGLSAEDEGPLRAALAAGEWAHAKAVLKRLCLPPQSAPVATTASWGPLIRDLFEEWERTAPALPHAQKRDALQRVLAAFSGSPDGLYARLRGLVRNWSDAARAPPTEPGALVATGDGLHGAETKPLETTLRSVADTTASGAAHRTSTAPRWAGMLVQTLILGVVAQLTHAPDLKVEGQAIADQAKGAQHDDPDETQRTAERLRQFWIQLEINGASQEEIQRGLLRVLHLLTTNVAELIGEGSWMRGQLEAVAALADGEVTAQTIAALEAGLRECTFQQGVLKPALDQAKEAMKVMVSLFIDRMSELATETDEYQEKLARYATEIERAEDLGQLSTLIVDVIEDTRGLQGELAKSHEELLKAKRTVEEHQNRARRLEAELAALSDRLHEDFLTATLNRRGLQRAFEAEAARTDRHERPLSLAVLDVDNFKSVNDQLGHQAGDQALVHLTRVIRQSIRPSDVISRFGGEEFVILLPETQQEDAIKVMIRAQRELTRRFFLHKNERLLITFSAGVAQRAPGEDQESVIARADEALYRAKQAGKNRVEGASPAPASGNGSDGAPHIPAPAQVIPAAHVPKRIG